MFTFIYNQPPLLIADISVNICENRVGFNSDSIPKEIVLKYDLFQVIYQYQIKILYFLLKL